MNVPLPTIRRSCLRRPSWALMLSLPLILAACGGGGGGGGSSGDPPPPAAAWTTALATGDASAVDSATALSQTQALLQAQQAMVETTRQAVLGTGSAGGTEAVAPASWNPTHDSVYFTLLDPGRHAVLLTGNWRYKGSEAAAGRVLAVAGADPSTGARYAALGGNPLAVRGNAAMDTMLRNTMRWLTGRSTLNGLRVVTAHLPSTATYWFQHEAPTRAWLTAQVPAVRINGVEGSLAVDDSCDGSALAGCLQNADLLILGRQQGPNQGNSSTPDTYPAGYDTTTVMAALRAAQARGVPVLYLHHGRDDNTLSSALMQHFGLAVNNNYWAQEGLKDWSPTSLAASDSAPTTLALLDRLRSGHFSTTFSGCSTVVGKVQCEADTALQTEFNTPAGAIRSRLRALDAQGLALFEQPGYALEKHLVLLGDTWRRAVAYPMDKGGDKGLFFRALFSDMTAYLHRRHNATAAHQGSFASAIPAATPALVRTVTGTAPATGTGELMTGLYVMPGRSITLTREDAASATVTVGINLLRDTTRIYNPQGYDRPTQLASPRMPLIQGQPVTLTSPFGGPLYLFLGAASDTPAIRVTVEGVTTHPALRDMNDAAQVAAFKAEMDGTPTQWVGITTDALTVHSTLAHMRTTLAAHGGDMALLAQRLNTYMVEDTYALAGFHSASSGLRLPASVSAFCDNAGWDCTGPQHRRDVMQHVIVDTVALCGAGCSGNPYDQNWALDPLGWGETHEIGHNLQRSRLNIYGSRSTEVSNNIFPMHKQMAFARANPGSTALVRGDGDTRKVFGWLKDALQPGASADAMRQALWTATGTYDNAAERLVFYRQLVEYARHYRPEFTDGWALYTLMYLLERNLTATIASTTTTSADWLAQRSALGLGTYASPPTAMDGNDFMLIAASRIIGRDLRAVWSLWGITFSDAAAAQVAAYGLPAAELLLFPMKQLNAFGNGVGAPLPLSATASYPAGY
ncbi:ImpA family metalloprotease [Ideonella livida]|uniref:Peptidase M60 domain-containing protein n=1 Tax=Ideonella livida TaxID=2707176 RepID=A0A7C9TML5_9BURK|nr:ImpA family metalloprotease [Ideonella livida]NDY92447.1 hypothetical protein [Ideonella livida]